MDDLFSAIKNGNLEKVKELIDAGADLNAKDSYRCTPLHYISKGEEEIAKLLIEAGADIYAQNDEDQLPIALAFNDCNVDLIRIIADKMEKDLKNRKGIKNAKN